MGRIKKNSLRCGSDFRIVFLFLSAKAAGQKVIGLRLDGRQDLEKLKTAKTQKLIANG
jgi:hypothetical protein